MTNITRVIVLILFSAEPLAAATPMRHPPWMAGTWVWLNPGESFSREMCNADHNSFYDRNGTYEFLDDTGRWRIENDRLIERVTSTDEGGSGAKVGDTTTRRFRRVGARTLRILGRNGGTMVRCATQ